MAQQGYPTDSVKFSCSICLDLLKTPVTIPCGHNYCMYCIGSFWDDEDKKGIHSCPQCRQQFTPRPVLVKNTMLAELVEDVRKTVPQAAPDDDSLVGLDDVACDICTVRKMKAVKSCLFCLVSYCENHLRPHYDVPGLKNHKLVNPSKNLQENICYRHHEVMKIFCRTDQQCICYLCSMEEHKDHEIVPAAAERDEKQKELQESRQQIHQRIQDQEKDVKLLQQEVEAINVSADKAVEDSEEIFTQLIRLLQERSSDVKQQIRSQQETEVSRVKDVQEKLEQEISELKRKDAELEQLSHTEDHTQFLLNYPSLPALSESTHSSSIKIQPWKNFEDVTAALSELRGKLQDVLMDPSKKSSPAASKADTLPQPIHPSTHPISNACIPSGVARNSLTNSSKKSSPAASKADTLPQHKHPSTQPISNTYIPSRIVRDKSRDPPKKSSPKASKAALLPQAIHPPMQPFYVPIPSQVTGGTGANLQWSTGARWDTPWTGHQRTRVLPQPFQPMNTVAVNCREYFLQYSRKITLSRNTAHKFLELSEGNRKVTMTNENQYYEDHEARFTKRWQVLSKQRLTGRCYWEVEWTLGRLIEVAVAYGCIERTGDTDDSAFGLNEDSWALCCQPYKFTFNGDNYCQDIHVTNPYSSRVGVFLDHRAGILSFYSVYGSQMTLIHEILTYFNEPLHAGIWLTRSTGTSAEFIQLK